VNAARIQLTLAAVLALVALALGGVLLLGDDDPGAGSDDLELTAGFAGAQRSPDIPPVRLALRDQDGRRVSTADLRGHVTVLTFMYSTCQDSCPVIASQIRGALDETGDVPVYAISVDPPNDTPLSAKRFINRQSLTGRMRFLLGTRAQLAPVWDEFAIKPQGKGFEHSAYVVLLDRDGRQRVAFPFDKLRPEALAHDIRALGG
jgi:protein SCO1/2